MGNGKPECVGLDIGTSFIVCARMEGGKVKYTPIRSAFVELDASTRNRKMLKNLKHPFLEEGGKLYLVGDVALDMANAFSQEVRRPMQRGVLSPKEREGQRVMRMLIKEVCRGIPAGSTVVFSSPADPVDGSLDTTYHQELMRGILENDLKVKAEPMNEAYALAFGELIDHGLSGLCFSFGAGMVNAVMTFGGMDVLKYSLPKGGDWIDQNAANALGTTAAKMQVAKEEGLDISKPTTPEQEAIAIYYRRLIREAIAEFVAMFERLETPPAFKGAVPIVVAGGTSKPKGFIELFQTILDETDFPLQVKSVTKAEDELKAVAQGLLIAALDSVDDEADGESEE